ncbi:hypothetical protein EJ05DRAFT_484208 [Pseudovirgaria hyperparasitica]|uniref:Zinc finger C3HC4 RING-type domain-containing protein n=1 Tax=Pseudovirgaria hyperparasitica TaxID=470096 RepID=A0A6A6WCQ1_9PEZI|nr:uncharacterized protein EJ05DRAFT_484208 [Pseudovirgaria hyperparasitica]KAF2760483.1 hypothetical protein EJ05DRAFT_484208 [Pseudovirgaria hyperparasitica]
MATCGHEWCEPCLTELLPNGPLYCKTCKKVVKLVLPEDDSNNAQGEAAVAFHEPTSAPAADKMPQVDQNDDQDVDVSKPPAKRRGRPRGSSLTLVWQQVDRDAVYTRT